MNEDATAKSVTETLKLKLYYVLIGLVSLIALGFLPLLGSAIGLKWNVPDTTVGWIVWVGVRLIVSTINVLIYHCFMQQAKLNVAENARYKEATELLGRCKKKEVEPRSPRKWTAQQYGKKGSTLFITSAMATVALSQALLTFDWSALLTYLFTIVIGVVFGVLQMKQAELYWTTEYYDYAVMYAAQQEKENTCETTSN